MLKASIAGALPTVKTEASAWLRGLDAALDIIEQEPVVYLMGKLLS